MIPNYINQLKRYEPKNRLNQRNKEYFTYGVNYSIFKVLNNLYKVIKVHSTIKAVHKQIYPYGTKQGCK